RAGRGPACHYERRTLRVLRSRDRRAPRGDLPGGQRQLHHPHLHAGEPVIFLHEVHKVVGPKERDFEAAIRDELRAILGVDDRARLLWYLHQAHGTGPAYTVITITAFSDAAAWHDMAVRFHAGALRGFAS